MSVELVLVFVLSVELLLVFVLSVELVVDDVLLLIVSDVLFETLFDGVDELLLVLTVPAFCVHDIVPEKSTLPSLYNCDSSRLVLFTQI